METLLKSLTSQEAETFRQYLQAHKAPKGTLLLKYGKNTQDIYFLISGGYEIYRKVEVNGLPTVLKMGGNGVPAVLGEMNAFSGNKRNASIVISQDAHYFLLTHENHEKLKQNHPHIAIKLLETLGKSLADRFSFCQEELHAKMVNSAESHDSAIRNLKKYIGQVIECTPELSEKLFHHEQEDELITAEASA